MFGIAESFRPTISRSIGVLGRESKVRRSVMVDLARDSIDDPIVADQSVELGSAFEGVARDELVEGCGGQILVVGVGAAVLAAE